MAVNKKTTRKSRVKRPANKIHKKPSLDDVPVAPVKTVEVATSAVQPAQRFWIVLAVIVLLVLFSMIAIIGHQTVKPDVVKDSESQTSSPSSLRVVPGEEGGTSSTGASGALQPQPTGLQQSQPATQSAGGLSLQAQTSPDQTTIR